ncbi:MAG: substrate-binding domain-containing protein, partial [Pseudomonadota bacterium]
IWNSLIQQFDLQAVETDTLTAGKQTAMVAVLKDADRPTAALQFARYLTSRDKGMPHFARHHFEPIEDADVWDEHPEIAIMSGAMLKPGIEDALKRFEKREGVKINTTYNGCGILVDQMKAGAKPEAYVSCDSSFMTQVQDGFEPSVDLSRNPMVIVVQKGNPKGIKTLEDLTREGLKIGLAHPVNSALGALTDRLLKRVGLHEKLYSAENRVIHTPSAHMLINQMRTGSLDACVAYISNARSAPQNEKFLDTIEIPLPDALATQPYAVSKQTDHRYLMYRLRDAITTAETSRRFESLGFNWVYDNVESREPRVESRK